MRVINSSENETEELTIVFPEGCSYYVDIKFYFDRVVEVSYKEGKEIKTILTHHTNDINFKMLDEGGKWIVLKLIDEPWSVTVHPREKILIRMNNVEVW